jgi:phosphate transport system permease protein
VLFLSAVLLFIFTFIINTGAEMLRQRFRKKYGRY